MTGLPWFSELSCESRFYFSVLLLKNLLLDVSGSCLCSRLERYFISFTQKSFWRKVECCCFVMSFLHWTSCCTLNIRKKRQEKQLFEYKIVKKKKILCKKSLNKTLNKKIFKMYFMKLISLMTNRDIWNFKSYVGMHLYLYSYIKTYNPTTLIKGHKAWIPERFLCVLFFNCFFNFNFNFLIHFSKLYICALFSW